MESEYSRGRAANEMRSAVLTIFLFFCVVGTSAQQSVPAGLTGTVMDDQGAVIPGVKIEATNRKGKVTVGRSDINGRYKMELPSGLYDLQFGFPGSAYRPLVIKNYLVPPSVMMTLDAGLACDKMCGRVY